MRHYTSAPFCKECGSAECRGSLDWSRTTSIEHQVCAQGVSVVRLVFPDGPLICAGFLASGANSECSPSQRKRLRQYKIHWATICRWYEAIWKTFPQVARRAEERAKELVQSLHDVKAAVSTVTRNAEALLNEQPGDTEESKEDNAPPELRSLVQAVRVLHARLSMTALVHNPEAAKYGEKHPTPVYRLFHRLVRIYESVAARKCVFVKGMAGVSYNKPLCYDSFDILALTLVDNAVKYSHRGKEVLVRVNDAAGERVEVAVESYGPVLADDELAQLFDRGFRGRHAKRFTAQGFGLGMSIAKTVADAHGFKIEYERSVSKRDSTVGNNVFTFTV